MARTSADPSAFGWTAAHDMVRAAAQAHRRVLGDPVMRILVPIQIPKALLVVRRFELRAVEEVDLPPFLGSTLRGAIGRALRRLVCATNMPTCEGCPVRPACAYAALHDGYTPDDVHSGTGTHAPPPLWIRDVEPGRRLGQGETLRFSMAAFGPATRSLLFVDEAVRALRRTGLGRGRGGVELIGAEDELRGDLGALLSARTESLLRQVEQRGDGLRVHLRTPVSIRLKGHAWASERARPTWIGRILGGAVRRHVALARRWLEVSTASSPKAAALASTASEVTVLEERVRFRKVRRYSATQGRHVEFHGAVGMLRLSADGLPRALPWLVLGELLSLGSGTTFGFGRIDLEVT